MPQQINLCAPILTSKKRYFSALTMAQALAVYWLIGGLLAGLWVWSHTQSSRTLRQEVTDQERQISELKKTVAELEVASKPNDLGLQQALQHERELIQQHGQLLKMLQKGMYVPGMGHSDWLRLVAQSIPEQAWITDIKADGSSLEVIGFTLEPTVLNDWVNRLAASPNMQGMQLSDVQVQNVSVTPEKSEGLTSLLPLPQFDRSKLPDRPVWGFSLLSAQPKPAADADNAASAPANASTPPPKAPQETTP